MQIHARAHIDLPQPPEVVFDYVTQPHTFPKVFRGYGPIPGMKHVTLLDNSDRLHTGQIRIVTGEDGAQLKEKILVLDRPHTYAYEILGGLRFPLSLLVKSGNVEWSFLQTSSGNQIIWHYHFTLTSPLAYPAASMIVKFFFQPAMQQCLERIQTNLRQETTPTT